MNLNDLEKVHPMKQITVASIVQVLVFGFMVGCTKTEEPRPADAQPAQPDQTEEPTAQPPMPPTPTENPDDAIPSIDESQVNEIDSVEDPQFEDVDVELDEVI